MRFRYEILQMCVTALVIVISWTLPLSASTSQEITKPVRAFHIVLLNISPADAKRLADQAAAQQFNTIVLNVLWGASVQLKTFPWKVRTKPWKRKDLLDVVNYMRAKGIEVVPQMHLLSHQQVLLKKYRPDLMYNQQTYDPNKQAVYEIILPMIDELVDLIKPKAFHIGHDEVVGWEENHAGKFLDKGEKALPSDLFLKDVLILHNHLKKKNIAIWMWGDMLIAPHEFPEMFPPQLHGTMPGYGKPLRDKLPHDIVICDWHYFDIQFDFPSLSAMQREGFRVIGVTWNKDEATYNFSRYAARHGAYGMMATTWFYVQRREWDLVKNIIYTSGKAFLKDFPDAK